MYLIIKNKRNLMLTKNYTKYFFKIDFYRLKAQRRGQLFTSRNMPFVKTHSVLTYMYLNIKLSLSTECYAHKYLSSIIFIETGDIMDRIP